MKHSNKYLFWLPVLLAGVILLASSCRVKKCATFDDPQRDYKVKYDRHGLKKR